MKDLLKIQQKYNRAVFGNGPKTSLQLERHTQELALCAHAEISSLVGATRYRKHHIKNNDPGCGPNESTILYESVDVIRYIMAIMNLWNIDTDKFETAFRKKDTYLNIRKRIDDNPWLPGMPVVIIDMDDVIAEFRSGFADWLSDEKDIHPDISSREYYFIDALKESGRNPEKNL